MKLKNREEKIIQLSQELEQMYDDKEEQRKKEL